MPEEQQVVPAEEEPQPADTSKNRPLQHGLKKFSGNASEKKAAKPVLVVKLPTYTLFAILCLLHGQVEGVEQ